VIVSSKLSGATMANAAPPLEVIEEFLRILNELVSKWEQRLVPVARGSLLLRHWFGEAARPAADLDLECFHDTQRELTEEERADREDFLADVDEEERTEIENRFGPYGEFESLVDWGKALCRYAARGTFERYGRNPTMPEIEYRPTEAPEDGASLYVYGTPGERYYTDWVWHGRGGATGLLQIDISQAGSYQLADIGVADAEFISPSGITFRCPAYTPEMLLAAKFSWLLRGLSRPMRGGRKTIQWTGAPKDLFDAHLLLTRAELRADVLQRSLVALSAEDKLDWANLDSFFAVRQGELADKAFSNWDEFLAQHRSLVTCGPAEMLRTIAERIEPLLGDFYPRNEIPFLRAIQADSVDEVAYLVYSDWLEEHGHARGEFLRLFTTFHFRLNDLPTEERSRTIAALHNSLRTTSTPWLLQLFGTSARLQEITQRIERAAV
jgi:uncharacterized protein (TIGR02996 family)